MSGFARWFWFTFFMASALLWFGWAAGVVPHSSWLVPAVFAIVGIYMLLAGLKEFSKGNP